jgi:hypothetical protein
MVEIDQDHEWLGGPYCARAIMLLDETPRRVERSRWHTYHYGARLNRAGHHGACSHHTPIAQANATEDHGFRTDPASITNYNISSVHRQLAWIYAVAELMVAVSNINVRAKHITITDFD